MKSYLAEWLLEHKSKGLAVMESPSKASPDRIRAVIDFARTIEKCMDRVFEPLSATGGNPKQMYIAVKDAEARLVQGRRNFQAWQDGKRRFAEVWDSLPPDHPDKIFYNTMCRFMFGLFGCSCVRLLTGAWLSHKS